VNTQAPLVVNEDPSPSVRPAFVKGTAIELIKGLKTPRLSPAAQRILTEMSLASQVGTYEGVNLHYNESKISLLLPETLTFLPGSSRLDRRALDILTTLMKPLKETPFSVSIEGHTDNETGEGGDNMRLSIARALSVAGALISGGFPVGRVSVGGYGPYWPIADNSDLIQRRLNRRVEIHIMINEELN
jgi:outer membrane protein OmpA-like peptidoglycan-associated protein